MEKFLEEQATRRYHEYVNITLGGGFIFLNIFTQIFAEDPHFDMPIFQMGSS